MQSQDFDLFIVGGGSGGVRAARVAASFGVRVGLAEEHRIGGTCVLRGCVPKKLFVYASRFSGDFEDARGFGWKISQPLFVWSDFLEAKNRELERLEALYERGLKAVGVHIFKERAEITGPHSLMLTSGRCVTAEKILIATGGRPRRDLPIPGINHVLTSTEVLDLSRQPKTMIIVGGGYVSLEFASIFSSLGTRVTLLHRDKKILKGFDLLIRDGLTNALKARGVEFLLQDTIQEIQKGKNEYLLLTTGGSICKAEEILLAIGRCPNTKGLGLETAGVELDADGAVIRTSGASSTVPSIFAIGDVTNKKNLTPVAIKEGQEFAECSFGGKSWNISYDNVPTAVFSTPEIGTVGLTEEEARSQYTSVAIYETRFRPLRNVLAGREEPTLMKIVVHETSDRILGVHLLGPDSAEIIQMAAIALNLKATKSDFDRTMSLHPTAAEELVTLRSKR